MTDNHLFQLAQVISDLSPKPSSLDHEHERRRLPIRKNACVVCAVCFTCSKNYSVDCTCEESQPRRGKNLPHGGLDSRAKKLNRIDKEDYEFTIQWLEENAHAIYRDTASNQVVDLSNQTEVGLCKAHSSTLYRAKKRWEQKSRSSSSSSSSPSPSRVMVDTPTQSTRHRKFSKAALSPTIGISKSEASGGLAAKVKELYQQEQQQRQQHQQHQKQQSPSPMSTDLDMIPSTSYKRKRIDKDAATITPLSTGSSILSPQLSASTPLSATCQHHHSDSHHTASMSSPPLPYLSPQLPPLKNPQQPLSSIATSLNSLSSSLQQQLHLSSGASPKYYPHYPPSPSSSSSYNLRHYQLQHTTSSSSITLSSSSSVQYPAALTPSSSSPQLQQGASSTPPPPQIPSIHSSSIQIETVSLKSMPSDEPCIYFIRNLAITDTFTFRQLLDETDIVGAPPPPLGKRIIIADPSSERIFPLSQAIRSVLPYPSSSHMEFCLGLADKTSIDWNSCP